LLASRGTPTVVSYRSSHDKADDVWGQGQMTEVLAEVVTWALAQPSVFRISAVCDVENIGSARVMERRRGCD
jgi:RimJ/RimL family protein N-acetyltransferase